MKKLLKFNILLLLLVLAGLLVPGSVYAKKHTVKDVRGLLSLKNAKRGDVYILKKDIDLSGIEDWEPFDFESTLNGKGHTIKGLKSTKGGLFDNLKKGSKVTNLVLDVDINVLGTSFHTGAIANMSEKATLKKCFVKGKISSTGMTGGLIGKADSTKISMSASSAILDSGSTVGGLVGEGKGNMKIDNCLMIGKITKDSSSVCGGIVGEFEGKLVKCFTAAGSLSAESSSAKKGSIVGIAKKDTHISDCYYYGNVAGLGPDNIEYQSVIHLDEKFNSAIMKKLFATSLSKKIWTFSKKINGGMPILKWCKKYI